MLTSKSGLPSEVVSFLEDAYEHDRDLCEPVIEYWKREGLLKNNNITVLESAYSDQLRPERFRDSLFLGSRAEEFSLS